MLFDIPTLLISSYIFSWQFPHFYGILYENKKDYEKAGFVMISNEDPDGSKKAYKSMFNCNVANTAVALSMAAPQIAMVHPIFMAPYMYYQAKNF